MAPIVVDTSILVNGQIVRLVKNGLLDDSEIIIPTAVLDELQSQASQKKEQGFVGLEEIKLLRKLSAGAKITVTFEGAHPSLDDIMLSDSGRIDALIKDVAKARQATLFTSDRAQSMVAQAEGIDVQYHSSRPSTENLGFLKFFDDKTMSVHLKEGLPPMAKRGLPGDFELAKIGDETLARDYLQGITNEIVEAARSVDSGNIEISKPGAMVIQHNDYRIAITKPPFSEKFEITLVHPIVKMTLEDYRVSERLMERFSGGGGEGIIISGAPGSGKSTLASGLANFYHQQGKIVKTFESPRDLQVDEGITQYTKLDGGFENSADILLLVRPDYTVFDEVRRREDFEIYCDLRLTGVGMVGIVHANTPIDAIQRFVGKIELGMIPSVIDTVVFVEKGMISKVYGLELKVKVPSGMAEQDLARPVIEITNFEDDALEYEIYTFGEENVIIPVTAAGGDGEGGDRRSPVEKLAEERIRDVLSRYDPRAQIEFLSDSKIRVKVADRAIPGMIGRGGANINDLQKRLGLHIDVSEREEADDDYDIGGGGGGGDAARGPDLPFEYSESKAFVILDVGRKGSGRQVDVLVRGERVLSSRVGRRGQIKMPRRSSEARKILDMASSKNDITVRARD